MLAEYMNMCTPDRQFQAGPSSFNAVYMTTPVNVLADAAINLYVRINGLNQVVIRPQVVRVYCAALFHVLSDSRLLRYTS